MAVFAITDSVVIQGNIYEKYEYFSTWLNASLCSIKNTPDEQIKLVQSGEY